MGGHDDAGEDGRPDTSPLGLCPGDPRPLLPGDVSPCHPPDSLQTCRTIATPRDGTSSGSDWLSPKRLM